MTTVRMIEAKPAASGGMTLDELREFAAKTPGTVKAKAQVTWGRSHNVAEDRRVGRVGRVADEWTIEVSGNKAVRLPAEVPVG